MDFSILSPEVAADGSITVRGRASNPHKDPWKGLMG